ncbi:tol-pal system-associated acyl-CoA thioesterase [Paucibacter sp. Y2R2-4]|uniref:tol-pal system-associated acyl-CoA thioesterase n=1 Tax=Paucibacter sp. Y2R2-4 TaxID=2893553 RepID=UPI0021E396B7|nr:tol-pal system-associated acyl-CoA thioesterase [Paucibacter sp. Y2R2-4]MCV2348488.1 tol-pal system-associated acyl-CoA thioesterase [Paucibacter sp. Y2R2-4]
MKRLPPPFEREMRVYWEDTDAGGVVFYANYLKFFERARTEWLRAQGFSQEAMRLQTGVMFVVSNTQVRYLSPARLDDLLRVTVEVRELGRASMLLFQRAFCGERLLAEGEIRIGCVSSLDTMGPAHADLKPTRIPASLLEAINQDCSDS